MMMIPEMLIDAYVDEALKEARADYREYRGERMAAMQSAELGREKTEGNIRERAEPPKDIKPSTIGYSKAVAIEKEKGSELAHVKEKEQKKEGTKTSAEEKEKDKEAIKKEEGNKEKKSKEPNYKAFQSLRNIRRFGEPEQLPKILPKPEPVVIPRYNPSDSIPEPAEIFLYKPFVPLPNLAPYFGKPVEVHIAVEYLSNLNRAFRKKLIWGSDVYTPETDMVCALHHSGLLRMENIPPGDIGGLVVFCRVATNAGCKRVLSNGVYSRGLENCEEYGVRLEKIRALEKMRPVRELVKMAGAMVRTAARSFQKDPPVDAKSVTVPPEGRIVFNLSMDPVHKFTLPSFADYGRRIDHRLFNTFCKNCLYFEAGQRRFELYRDVGGDSFNLSEVKDPICKDCKFMETSAIPLPRELVVSMVSGKKWNSFRWGTNCTLAVKGVVIVGIRNFKFYPLTKARNILFRIAA